MLRSFSLFSRSFANDCTRVCCWHCNKLTERQSCDFFCRNCHSLLPISVSDYFALFNQPKTFDIDTSLLDTTYRAYQLQVHPDRFFRSPAREAQTADSVSQCVNEGYKTLSDPIRRAEYLLKLFKLQTVPDVPPDFLMDVMDIQEAVAEANDPKKLTQLRNHVLKMLGAEKDRLALALRIDGGKIAMPKQVGESLAKMKYLSRVRDAINEKLPVDLL
jgi:molecular chaperone HscB